jgi:uncharacterized protein (DUF885 family)
VNRQIATLIDEILRFGWRMSPSAATAVGIHEHDDHLIDCSPEALDDRLRATAAYRRELARLSAESVGLDPDETLDLTILSGSLEVDERQLEEARPARRDPAFYLDEILYGVYYLVEHDFAPLPDRARAAARRLLEVKRLLRQAKANLSDPAVVPREWVGAALQQIHGSLIFLSHLARDLAARAGSAGPEFERASIEAVRALDEFGDFLRSRLLGEARGSFAAGRNLFELLLRAQHGIEPDADALDEFGRSLVSDTEVLLAEAARAVDTRRPWQDLVGEWKADHPSEERLVEEYRLEVRRARDFVLARGLATLPDGETLRVVETPPFQRAVSPFAAYVAPAPFDAGREGVLWVTPPDDGSPAQTRARMLQDHMRPAIPATVVHEAYPGHHLQMSVACDIPSRVRRSCATPVLVEGWAFYCEELMAEQSYYPDARCRVLQLKDVLWRASRVVIDVGLHTRGMTVDQATALLIETARLDPTNARAEVLRYTRMPTQPMSYAVGRQAILDLRETFRHRLGASFDLKLFHDELLSYGSIPVGLIRDRMLAASSGPAPVGAVR